MVMALGVPIGSVFQYSASALYVQSSILACGSLSSDSILDDCDDFVALPFDSTLTTHMTILASEVTMMKRVVSTHMTFRRVKPESAITTHMKPTTTLSLVFSALYYNFTFVVMTMVTIVSSTKSIIASVMTMPQASLMHTTTRHTRYGITFRTIMRFFTIHPFTRFAVSYPLTSMVMTKSRRKRCGR